MIDLPLGGEIVAVSLTPGDHTALVPGDNWIIAPPPDWVAAQGAGRLDALAGFRAAGYAVQSDILYRPEIMGAFNYRINRATPRPYGFGASSNSSLGWGKTGPGMPNLPIYLDWKCQHLTYIDANSGYYPGRWYTLFSQAAVLYAANGDAWLASLRTVSADAAQNINAACLFTGGSVKLRVSLSPFGRIGGADPETGYIYSQAGAVQFTHPNQGIGEMVVLPDISINLGQSATQIDGIGSQYYVGGVDSAHAGLAILDQKDHGRKILIGVLLNHARGGFAASESGRTANQSGWSETAWLRAVIELTLSQTGGIWSAAVSILHTPSTLESASTLWSLTYQDGEQPYTPTEQIVTITGTGPVAPTPNYTYPIHWMLSLRGEHRLRRAMTAYYTADGAVRVRYLDYTANSQQTLEVGNQRFVYHQDECVDIVENGVVLSSLDSVADCSNEWLAGRSGCATNGQQQETLASIIGWRMKFHDAANQNLSVRVSEGSAIIRNGDIYTGPISTGGTCGSTAIKRQPDAIFPLLFDQYPVDVISDLSATQNLSGQGWLLSHYGGPIYDLWERGAFAWTGQSNSASAPNITYTRYVLRVAGGESMHADSMLIAEIDYSEKYYEDNRYVRVKSLDMAASVTPIGVIPSASYTYTPAIPVASVISRDSLHYLASDAHIDIAHSRYNRSNSSHAVFTPQQ